MDFVILGCYKGARTSILMLFCLLFLSQLLLLTACSYCEVRFCSDHAVVGSTERVVLCTSQLV